MSPREVQPPMPNNPRSARFPDGFVWGAATAAYQIEGSPTADGAGASIWHRFAHTPGKIEAGHTGDVACDHYRRYREDVALMKRLGLGAYRFSISWSRILPEGCGQVNPAGIDFYARLIDALLEAGIVPFVTLYHWDLPAALDDRGGWLNPDIEGWFADYAETCFRAFGDRVRHWMTLNEPWVVSDAGYLHGVHAPGHRNPLEAPIASHHLLLAHAAAVRAYRAMQDGEIGIVVNLEPKYAASDSAADLEAAARADAYMNRQFLDPLFLGRYPEEMAEIYGEGWPRFDDAAMRRIAEPIDFLAINYYTRSVTADDPAALPVRARSVRQPGALYTETGWEVHPDSLTRVLRWVRGRYGAIPLYITENGAAFPDPSTVAGDRLDDPLRVDYLRSHLLAAKRAIDEGCDLRGYFVWSLLDNLEWASGYTKRFGIVHVDFETQRRTPKTSAHRYREWIERNGENLLA